MSPQTAWNTPHQSRPTQPLQYCESHIPWISGPQSSQDSQPDSEMDDQFVDPAPHSAFPKLEALFPPVRFLFNAAISI